MSHNKGFTPLNKVTNEVCGYKKFVVSDLMSPTNDKNLTGFTLLEILLVAAILALLANFGVSSYRNYGKSVELDSVGKNIIYDLRQMRSRAAAGDMRRNWGAHFVNGAQDYYELFSTPTNYADAAKAASSTTYLPTTVIFTTPAESADLDIIFSSIAATTNANSVIINSESNIKTINVTISGTVY